MDLGYASLHRRSQGGAGGADAPSRATKKFSTHFWWNEEKWGDFGEVHPLGRRKQNFVGIFWLNKENNGVIGEAYPWRWDARDYVREGDD